jgi:hypothetical protein
VTNEEVNSDFKYVVVKLEDNNVKAPVISVLSAKLEVSIDDEINPPGIPSIRDQDVIRLLPSPPYDPENEPVN